MLKVLGSRGGAGLSFCGVGGKSSLLGDKGIAFGLLGTTLINWPLAGDAWRFFRGSEPGFGLGGRIVVFAGRRFSKGSGSGVIFILFLLPKSSVLFAGSFSCCLGLFSTLVNAVWRILCTGLGVGSASSPLAGTSKISRLGGVGGEGVFDFGAGCGIFSF